ncbi:MAG: hypothetical protein Q8P15_04125 [Nanoarchaeota archaeon]|nr:hypothetical protein [Nanoarchaeota archaeon]
MDNQRQNESGNMEPSIMTNSKRNSPPKTREMQDEDVYVPRPQENYSSQNQEQYIPEQQYAPQEETYTPQETYDSYSSSYDSETMIEIAEQVFIEKIKKIQKQVDEFSEFKNITEIKINNFSDRLKRIETMIDKLQISILEKIGSYGKNLENTKKEMDMMQDSFRKVVNSENKKIQKK